MGLLESHTEIAKEEITAQCGCIVIFEGEIDANKADGIVVDSDGIHRLQ